MSVQVWSGSALAPAREGTPMLEVLQEENWPNPHAPCAVAGSLLDELAHFGARQMPAAAPVNRLTTQWRDDAPHLVVRAGLTVENGLLAERPDISASNERVA